jgi:hypoxanthine phosphoribosyltransferase
VSERPTSYSYENRDGIRPISWEDFHGICKGLAKAVEAFNPEMILAVGRGGFYPGTLISHILRTEIYPVRLSRRVNDVVQFESPQWYVRPPDLVKGKRVLIVDEISSSGETLQVVKDEADRLGASQVRCAVMYAHSRGTTVPDYIGLVSDELLLNPWDREILKDGVFHFHPEYVGALEKQGIEPDAGLRIDAPIVPAQKG